MAGIAGLITDNTAKGGGKAIRPVGIVHTVYKNGGIYDQGYNTKSPHASTPHATNATTSKQVPSWLNSAALTPDQMNQMATDEANQSIQSELMGAQQQQATYDAQQKAYQAAMTGFYSALAPYMAQIQGNVSDAYNSAAQTMGQIGQGYAGVLGQGAQANADATTAALQRAGQTQAIPYAQAQANPGASLTDAFAALHGGIDGSSFAQQGAAKAAAAAQQPAIWAAQGRDSLTEAINKAVAGDQDYANQIQQIYAKVPALRDTILNQIQQSQIDLAKYKQDAQKIAFDENAKKVSLTQAQQRINNTAQNNAFNQKAKVASLNLQAQKFSQSAMNQDRNYSLQLAKLGISQKKLQLSIAAQEYKLANGGFTASEITRFQSKLQSVANALVEKTGPNGQMQWFVPKNKAEATAGKATLQTNYAGFVKAAVAAGAPISMAIQKANSIFPPTDRPTPQELAAVTGISTQAAAAGTGFNSQLNSYNQMVGMPNSKGQTVLGTGPNGQTIMLQNPGKMSKATKGILQGAVDYLGTPYAWGGESPSGFDCSGLAQYLYGKVGVNIPRTTYDQFKGGISVPSNQLQPGDLVFFKGSDSKNGLPGHVGIYVGGGKMIDAPHTGSVVRVESVSSFGGYMGARRYTK